MKAGGAGRIALGSNKSTCQFWGAYKKKVNLFLLYNALTAILRFSKVYSLLIFLTEIEEGNGEDNLYLPMDNYPFVTNLS